MNSNTYFTADHHMFHKNILKHCNRPFETIEEMNEKLIENWNGIIKKDNDVYYLGDFFITNKANKMIDVLSRLNGNIHLIKGNHDNIILKKKLHGYFKSIQDYKELNFEGRKYVLCHFPILSFNGMHRGSYHLHGHSHGSINYLNINIPRLDVGVDCHNYTPISLEQVNDLLKDRVFQPVDHHGQ